MSQDLTLITGASGFVGASIALKFLRAGHPVRLALRNAEQTHAFKQGKFAQFQDKISFAFVSDITTPGSYDEAVQDVKIIVHSASPASSVPTRTDNRRDVLDPAIQGATGILRSATKSPSVQRVVLTSSVAAHYNPLKPAPAGTVLHDGDWNPTTYEQAAELPIVPENAMIVYATSKALAEKAAWDFIAKEKPQFSLVTVNPAWVTGASQDPFLKKLSNLRSSHGVTVQNLFNVKEYPQNPLSYVDVEDVAECHHGAATKPDSEVAGKRFLAVGGPMTYNRSAIYIARAVPELASRMPKTTEGDDKVPDTSYDASHAANLFLNGKWTSLEESMSRFAVQIAELYAASQ